MAQEIDRSKKADPLEDDLLGALATKTATPAPAAADDLLSLAATTRSPTPAAAAAPVAARPDGESLPLTVNRWVGENKGDSWRERGVRAGASMLRGVGDVGDTLAQGIAATGEGGANVLGRMGVISPESNAAVKDWHAEVNRGIDAAQKGFSTAAEGSDLADIGRIGGQVLGTIPFLAGGAMAGNAMVRGAPIANALAARPLLSAVVGGAASGAGASALTSAASDAPFSDQMLMGAGVGGVIGPLGRGASALGRKLFSGGVDAETAALARSARDTYGIPVGPGQITANPTVRFMDSVLQRLPFTGYGARVAEQQSAFNRAIGQTFGEDVEHITPAVIRRARNRIGTAFDDVANRTGPIQVDHAFAGDLGNIVADARSVLGRDADPIISQVRRIADRIDQRTGTLSPESYQSLTRKDTPLSRAAQSKDPNVRYYAGQLREALDDVMQRSAPADVVQDLVAARAQYKALKTVEPLAKKATTGNISPANVLSAVNKSYSGDGGALGELGRVGQRFLKEPPSSGTAERSLVLQNLMPAASGLIGAGGIGAATYFDPESWQRNALLGLGTAGLARGSGSVLRSDALANFLIRRGLTHPGAGPVYNPLRAVVSPSAGALAGRPQPALLPAP